MEDRPEDGDCCCLRWSVGPEGSTVGREDRQEQRLGELDTAEPEPWAA